ncbi:hypothetical protein SAMN05216226_106148 [Halovenus aranensis]|uniref:Uncharacterized protein n=1 Tax=Halovenus aranensis TaxID=890420 RepID=A0A1G8VCW1_9EURY|nr:hypothetical protein [Halovenus aranensis]SDJ63853.1 hypothetical protein SAMN05216226_106148 [Halovenus aranensis]
MRRRDFLRTGTGVGLTITIAGCNTSSDDSQENDPDTSTPGSDGTTEADTDTTGEDSQEDEQQTEADPENAVRYFFEDETGALGHLGDDETPENYDHIITNSTTESEYQEMQRNDRAYAEDAASSQTAPNGQGLNMSVDEMIARAEEIYNNPEQHIDTLGYEDLNFAEEDDEIVFTRALIKASQEAGVSSSAAADWIVSNIAEEAVNQINPDFSDFKLSSIFASEPVSPNSTGGIGGAERENEWGQTYINSGFRHIPALLQYERNGEANVKYVEQTNSVNVDIFRRVIRDPESSLYRSSLDQDTVNVSRDSESGESGNMFPEHYVTALDYTKARELESEDILGLTENDAGVVNAVGDWVGVALFQMVDDMGITGYDNNPDRDNTNIGAALDGTLVSDSFGQALEEFVTDPTPEKREYIKNISRGLYQIQQEQGWEATVALEGTLEDPEILPTNQATINAVRGDQAYDQVRERVAG